LACLFRCGHSITLPESPGELTDALRFAC
jgi:hypothetical protein